MFRSATLLLLAISASATLSPITTCTKPGLIALTFDDGPDNYLADLAAKKLGVSVTFFMNGDNYSQIGTVNPPFLTSPYLQEPYASAVKAAYAAGHQIANQ